MFASLTGIIQKKHNDHIILVVHGVGYKVICSELTISQLNIGENHFFYIETLIGEDYIKLFGFLSEAEKNWFLLLSSVQGVGGKAALAILSVARPDMISDAILLGDKAIITKASGVGPKLADRIINELKHKKDLPQCYDTDTVVVFEHSAKVDIIPVVSDNTNVTQSEGKKPLSDSKKIIAEKRKIIESACSALVNLGYSRSDSLKAIHDVQNDDTLQSENILIGAALKHIAQLKENV
jgi:holliday junction DNA helicase RuvA